MKFLKLFFAKGNNNSYCIFSVAINFNTSGHKSVYKAYFRVGAFPAKMQAVVSVLTRSAEIIF